MTFTEKLIEYAKSCENKTRIDLNLYESIDWCAETVKHIVNHVRKEYGAPFNISCTQSHNNAVNTQFWYEPDDMIKAGDIIYYNWGHDYDPTGNLDHTGIVIAVHDGVIDVIEGNTAGRGNTAPVKLVHRNISDLNFNCQYPDYYIRIKPEYNTNEITTQTLDNKTLTEIKELLIKAVNLLP